MVVRQIQYLLLTISIFHIIIIVNFLAEMPYGSPQPTHARKSKTIVFLKKCFFSDCKTCLVLTIFRETNVATPQTHQITAHI